jgi:DNA-directed RNA polymerase
MDKLTDSLVRDHDEQLELEREMCHYGEKRFHDKQEEAKRKGTESTTPAAMALLKGAIEPVAKGIDNERKKLKSDRAWIHGRLFIALEKYDSETLAYLTLKSILDSVSRMEALNTMAIKVGRAIEDDLMLTSFIQQNKPLMDKVKRSVKKKSTNYKYQKNVMVHSATKAGLEFDNWATDYRLGLGIRLIDIVISTTNLFEIHNFKSRGRGRLIKHLVPTRKTMSWILKKNEYMSILRPLRLPSVVKPKPWTGLKDGGYFSLKTPLIRFNSDAVLADYFVMSDNAGIDFKQVYDVVNAVQDTPWKINKSILEVIDHFWTTVDEDVLECLPRKNDMVQAPFPGEGATEEQIKEWKIVASKVYKENIRGMSQKIAFHKMLWVADKFKDKDSIWFPTNLDFRGRVYPIPDFLNPQGDDVSKALLLFAEGKPIKTEHGKKNFLMYGASLYGLDKESDEDKLIWINQNVGWIGQTANDPKTMTKFWSRADKPWQFLAWCFEFNKWRSNPNAKLFIPVMVDGTCNGLQHLSALMKDRTGGDAVNLTDTGDTPNDIYQLVSDEANKIYKGPIKIDRKLCKRPVMTTPYGATIYGMREQVMQELKKRKTKMDTSMEFDDFDEMALATDAIYEGISKVIVKSREFMDWLQDIAEVMATNNIPMEWKTPFGFYVYQAYYTYKQRRLRTQLNGDLKGYRTSLRELIPFKQDVRKNKNAISPNFIHSLDAAHLMLTVNDLRYEYDIKDLHVVHDCYGVHADSVDLLVHTLKENFIEMYQGDGVVDSFIEDYLKGYLDKHDYFKVVEQRPMTGTLDINEVRESRFFFS